MSEFTGHPQGQVDGGGAAPLLTPRIYLDHNGSTPTTPEVSRELRAFVEGFWGNAGAGHPDGRAASDAIGVARERVAAALGAKPEEVTFTSGGTESNNWALRGMVEALPAERRHMVCGLHEHLSVIRTVERLESEGLEVTWIRPTTSGAVRVEDLAGAIRPNTGLVSLMLANNETGILQPIQDAAAIAHGRGARLFVDAVCGVGKVPVNVRELGCDALSLSGHKLHAPKGIGALWVREGVDIAPLIHGCGQQDGRRSGTENTMGAVALGAAMEHFAAQAKTGGRARPLRDRLWRGIEALGLGATRNGQGRSLGNTMSVWFPGYDALELQQRLGAAGLSVSAQSSAPRDAGPSKSSPSHVLRAMGLDATRASESLRFSLGSTTTEAEIDAALAVLRRVLGAPARPPQPPSQPPSQLLLRLPLRPPLWAPPQAAHRTSPRPAMSPRKTNHDRIDERTRHRRAGPRPWPPCGAEHGLFAGRADDEARAAAEGRRDPRARGRGGSAPSGVRRL